MSHQRRTETEPHALHQRTRTLLDACTRHLDHIIAYGDAEHRQRAALLRAQVEEVKSRLALRKEQGEPFNPKESHVLEHVIPIFLSSLAPGR